MQALWIENKTLRLRRIVPETADEFEVQLAVKLAGICGTDLELLRGYYDFKGVPGHEFVGTVTQGPADWIKKRVVVDINLGCGRCQFCQQGLNNHCTARQVIGIKNKPGAFAEFLTCPVSNLLSVPDELSDELAVLVEPVAAALEIVEQLTRHEAIARNSRMLIVGAGRLGRIVSLVMKEHVDHLSVCIRSPVRDADFDPEINVIRPSDTPQDFDYVIECSGSETGFKLALAAVKARGALIVKSTYGGQLTFDMSRIVVDEIRLIGSRCGPMALAIDWLCNHQAVFNDMSVKYFALQDFQQAFVAAGNSAVGKVYLQP